MADPWLQHLIGGQPNSVSVALGLQKLAEFGLGESRIGTKVEFDIPVTVTDDHRLQNQTPILGVLGIAWTKGAALQIAELVEHEQRVIACAAEVTVVGGAFLRAIGRAPQNAEPYGD